jgi:hypothetical protein
MFVLLHSYRVKNALNTIRGMISRYAPDCENNTGGYISRVAKDAGIDANATIDTNNKAVMIPVVAAMSAVENSVPAVMQDVRDGWELFVKYRP